MSGDVVVKVHGLKKYFELRKGFFSWGEAPTYVKALDGVDFTLRQGEILGLVGESGCGKTTTGRLLTRLEDPSDGSVFFLGRDIALLEGDDLKVFRRNIQMVFQDPYESLNPRNTVLQTVMEPLINHNIGDSFEARVETVTKALEDAGLAPAKEYLARFPHELSGGQRQRVSIARALVMNPRVIVADEPVSMLDVSIRAGVLNLMLDLRDKYHIPYLFITHDIAVARYVSDRLAVMYLGKIVELADTDEVVFKPYHPYTQALLSAVPVPDPVHKHGRISIKGEVPSAINIPLGCRFRPRCPKAFRECGFQGADLADWLTSEEKVSDPGHQMASHMDKLLPDGFSLVVTVKPGGSAGKIREFLSTKASALRSSMPMFDAISSIEEAPGDREIVVTCKAVNISGEALAAEILDRLNSVVEYRSHDHPMYGTILNAERQGARIVLTIGEDKGASEDVAGAASRLDSTRNFMRDFLKHHSRAGYPEFKGASKPEVDPSSGRVVITCGSGRKPADSVADQASRLILKDIVSDPASPFHNRVLPMKTKGSVIRIRVGGREKLVGDLEASLAKYFKEGAGAQSDIAAGVTSVRSRTTKGPEEIVAAMFIRTEEPPLVDVGGGRFVACYLFKPAAP